MGQTKNPFENQSQDVFDNIKVLSEEYMPDEILERDTQIDEYGKCLGPALQGAKPSNVMAFGPTGVGKTAVTNYVLRLLKEKCREKDVDLEVVWQNCEYNSVHKCFTSLANDIRPPEDQIPKTGIATSDVMDAIYERFEEMGDIVILVLDEIDHLDKIDDVLYGLTRAESIGHLGATKLCIVGISNNYKFTERLSPKTKGTLKQREIDFYSYDAQERNHILEPRIEKTFQDDVVTEQAKTYCSARTAQDTGNARQALNILKEAGRIAQSNGDVELVEDHIAEAKIRVERGQIASRIEKLTHHQQILLETVARLEAAGWTPARSKTIFEQYQDIAKPHVIEALSTVRTVRENLSKLAMRGFLYAERENKGRAGGVYNLYETDLQPETIVDTLATTPEYMIYEANAGWTPPAPNSGSRGSE
jgi:orc1/cdc6 family replication initiation protein